MARKTYVLLDENKSTVPIYQRVMGKRVRMEGMRVNHAYLRQTFTDENGKNKTIRYKDTSDSIYQDEQIKDGIPANEPFTQAEHDAVRFYYGQLTTENETLQRFLEASGQFDAFKGRNRGTGTRAMFKLYDPQKEINEKNSIAAKQIDAAYKVKQMTDLKEAQDLMILLNGSTFSPPNDLKVCQNQLWAYINGANDAELDKILREESNESDKASILLTRAVNAGIISFDQQLNEVSKKNGERWLKVKELASEIHPEERKKMFAQFLLSKDGKLLFKEIQKDLDILEKQNASVTA